MTFPVRLAKQTITYADCEISAISRQTKSSCICSCVISVFASKL